MNKKKVAILLAILAAVFYAINTPFSKLLLNEVEPTLLASFLYFGAGIGVAIIYTFKYKKEKKEVKLTKSDLPYVIGMILLDIAAPILLMIGIKNSDASSASLLGNFEIVATTLIALLLFKEKVSKTLWIAIGFITLSSFALSFSDISNFKFSIGSIFVILATICWGFENNCTRKISNKSTYQIVTLKGIFSGLGSLIIGLCINESFPKFEYIIFALLLGFVAYGLSIFTYIKTQSEIGAAKTSAFYAIAPFLGTFLALILLNESIGLNYIIGLIIMIIGSVFAVIDTLKISKNDSL